MVELIKLLEEYFNKDSRYHSKSELIKSLHIKGEEAQNILDAALNSLIEDGYLFFDEKKGYKTFPKQEGYAFGKIQTNKNGTGFVHTNNGYTILIENIDLNGALDGDNVIVSDIKNKRKDYYSGKIYKVTKRKVGNIICEAVEEDGKMKLVPYNSLESTNFYINKNELKNLINGELLLVKVGTNKIDNKYEATIEKSLGHKDRPGVEIELIANKYGINIDFPKQVKEEAKNFPSTVLPHEYEGRIDLRDENIFTIDCDNTKDKDDAVGIKKLDNGNYLLKVSIAHVSHYVKEGTATFEEALNRCSSHYPGGTCIPMLEQALSNGICSLNPNVDRLTRTIEMEINPDGEVVNYNIYKSVIRSRKAMSYSKVNKVLNGENIEDYSKYKYDLILMSELNDILEKARLKRHYLDFDTKEVEAVQSNGIIKNIKPVDYGKSGKIIENFMLVANETVYKDFAWFILAYRIHEAPDEEKVKEILNMLRQSNINIPKVQNINVLSLKRIINSLDDSELSLVVRECILRSMKKARYDTNNVGHFALQYDTYGHFTSPIRRIIDLITHMTIDNIEKFDYSKESIKNFENFLNTVCKKANEVEKIDKQLEDDVMDMLMSKYMEDKVGEQFEVIVTAIDSHSMLVRTKDLIRGKIKLENIQDDNYYYDYDKKAIIGRKTHKKYQIGNKMIVLLKDASSKTRTVNFEVPKQKVLKIS